MNDYTRQEVLVVKQRISYRINNWKAYNKRLVNRGRITFGYLMGLKKMAYMVKTALCSRPAGSRNITLPPLVCG